MGRREGGRGMLAVITGTRYGGQVSKRDVGSWPFTGLAAGAAALFAVAGWWWTAAIMVTLTASLAGQALALARTDGHAARRELLGVLRRLEAIPADGAALLNRDARHA